MAERSASHARGAAHARGALGAGPWLTGAFLLLSGCDTRATGACVLTPAQRVALADGPDFDGIALVTLAGSPMAIYSDRGGLWAKGLRSDGGGGGAATRLGARCRAGLSTAASQGGVALACLRAEPGAGGHAVALQLRVTPAGTAAGPELVLGEVGEASSGIAVAEHAGALFVAFHDGSADAHRVWLRQVPREALAAPTVDAAQSRLRAGGEATLLSAPGQVAQSPALGAHAGRLYAAFVTLALSFDAPGAQLHVAEVGGHARFRLPIRHHDATPQLTSGARALLISYRDRPTPAARIEHFVLALGPELAPAGAARRIGRASGARGPTLSQCGVSTYSAVPIEHGSELYVIFHALDAELAPREANHQCYATERSFVAAATACDGAGVYALVAEASDPSGAPAELLGMRYACSSAP